MNVDQAEQLRTQKTQIREQAHANRKAQLDKEPLSETIVRKFMELPEYAAASTVMFYVDVRTEVRTRHSLPVLGMASGSSSRTASTGSSSCSC